MLKLRLKPQGQMPPLSNYGRSCSALLLITRATAPKQPLSEWRSFMLEHNADGPSTPLKRFVFVATNALLPDNVFSLRDGSLNVDAFVGP